MLLEKHITVLTKKNSTVLNRSSLHVARVNMVHLECVFQEKHSKFKNKRS